jgi:cytochrome c5
VIIRAIALCAIAVAASQLVAQSSHQGHPAGLQLGASTARTQSQHQTINPGQQVFQQNCARCHNSPEAFRPSISGTIAHHMRVRANLSEGQYKALLNFLNP